VVKKIQLVGGAQHPWCWNSVFAHKRKLELYQVDLHWYTDPAYRLPPEVRYPLLYDRLRTDNQIVLILEDLDARVFPRLCLGMPSWQIFVSRSRYMRSLRWKPPYLGKSHTACG